MAALEASLQKARGAAGKDTSPDAAPSATRAGGRWRERPGVAPNGIGAEPRRRRPRFEQAIWKLSRLPPLEIVQADMLALQRAGAVGSTCSRLRGRQLTEDTEDASPVTSGQFR